jgi:hypothetical protein
VAHCRGLQAIGRRARLLRSSRRVTGQHRRLGGAPGCSERLAPGFVFVYLTGGYDHESCGSSMAGWPGWGVRVCGSRVDLGLSQEMPVPSAAAAGAGCDAGPVPERSAECWLAHVRGGSSHKDAAAARLANVQICRDEGHLRARYGVLRQRLQPIAWNRASGHAVPQETAVSASVDCRRRSLAPGQRKPNGATLSACGCSQ